MSLKKKAAQVQRAGRKNIGEDSVLAHISPEEAMRLKMQGGSGRTDPNTGLPHFDENGDGGAGGSTGANDGMNNGISGGIGYGNYGLSSNYGFSRADTNNPSIDEGGISNNGFSSPVDSNQGQFGGDTSGYTGLDSIYDPVGFSPANDSQAANVDNGFAANSDFSGPVDFGSTTSTTDNMFDPRRMKNFAVNQIAAKLGVPGAVMGLGRAAMGSSPADTAASFGSTAAGVGLGALAGPLGLAGGYIGNALGNFEAGRTDAGRAEAGAGMNATNAATSGGGFDLGSVLTGLAGLYQGSNATGAAQQAANVAQNQTSTLANIYGQDSPYATALRQQLDRRDAAAGRRSQYGPREVELQAALANAAVKNAPNVLAANRDALTLGQQAQTAKGQNLAGLFSLAKGTGLTDYANRNLKSLFGSSSAPTDAGVWTPSGYSNAPAPTGNGDFGYGSTGSNFMDTVNQWLD